MATFAHIRRPNPGVPIDQHDRPWPPPQQKGAKQPVEKTVRPRNKSVRPGRASRPPGVFS